MTGPSTAPDPSELPASRSMPETEEGCVRFYILLALHPCLRLLARSIWPGLSEVGVVAALADVPS
jgi:hypothetical protein